ncbi:unnamed protein product [Lampetra fluviatilis]
MESGAPLRGGAASGSGERRRGAAEHGHRNGGGRVEEEEEVEAVEVEVSSTHGAAPFIATRGAPGPRYLHMRR